MQCSNQPNPSTLASSLFLSSKGPTSWSRRNSSLSSLLMTVVLSAELCQPSKAGHRECCQKSRDSSHARSLLSLFPPWHTLGHKCFVLAKKLQLQSQIQRKPVGSDFPSLLLTQTGRCTFTYSIIEGLSLSPLPLNQGALVTALTRSLADMTLRASKTRS